MKDLSYFSNIYWHFTGSPKNVKWHMIRFPKQITQKPKSNDESFRILLEILLSKTLIASATEKISNSIESDKFCCVTDIPLKDLPLHSKTYGKVAIGFSGKEVQFNFNPVLYLPSRYLPRKSKTSKIINIPIPAIPEGEITLKNWGFKKNNKGHYDIPGMVDAEIDSSKLPKHIINHFKLTEFSEKLESHFIKKENGERKMIFILNTRTLKLLLFLKAC